MADVVILGAGLTGLSTAYHLEKNNFFNFKIFEKESRAGGLLRSFNENGFTFDFTGHLLHISDKSFYDFLNEIAGIENFFIQDRKSFIYTNERFTPYPFQSNLFGLPENIIYESIAGFINRKTNIKKPNNFHDWVLKFFGPGLGKHFFFPYNKKLLSYDLKKVSPSWTGRFVPQTNLKSIIKSAIKPQNNLNIGYNNKFYYPNNGGIQFLIDKLENKIKSNININFEVTNIDLQNKIIIFKNGHIEKFNLLISTMPLDNLLRLIIDKTDTNFSKQAKNLECNSVINFNLGFNENNIKDKHWIYFPENKYNFYRLGFWQNICKNSAPNNRGSIYGETSYIKANKTQKQIDNLTNKSIEQALNFLNLNIENIVAQKILNLNNAYVIYNSWREKNLLKLHNSLNIQFIHSIGRFGAWRYSSMQEDFLDGQNTAIKILNEIKIKRPQINLEKGFERNGKFTKFLQ